MIQITLILMLIFISSLLCCFDFSCKNLIEIRSSSIHNKGVFANRNINANDIIEIVPLLMIDKKHVDVTKTNTGDLVDYALLMNDNNYYIMLGLGSLYNHSDNFNAEWEYYNPDNIIIRAVKNIPKDSEILVHYGDKYWNARKDIVKI